MNYSVIEIANKIIAQTDVERGDTISNLKLQKLLYYLQGFFIAVHGENLFNENIEAWQYGPVVREAYLHFKDYGGASINVSEIDDKLELTKDEQILFNAVMKEYSQFSAIRLMDMTHEEPPWRITFERSPKGVIDTGLLKDYFKTQLA